MESSYALATASAFASRSGPVTTITSAPETSTSPRGYAVFRLVAPASTDSRLLNWKTRIVFGDVSEPPQSSATANDLTAWKSVPTVEALLGPPEDRPKKFYLGNREYDPVNLGYKFDKIDNGFEFDTTIRGNWNTGHEFRKEYSKEKEIKGVIGPALSPGDRKALIEYLKTL